MPNPTIYGIDVQAWDKSGLPDLDPYGRLVTGNQLLSQAILNRLFNAPGSYLQSPSFGFDIFGLINQNTRAFSTGAVAAAITSELQKEERLSTTINPVVVTVTFNNPLLSIRILVTPSLTSPFTLTMSIQNVMQPSNFQLAFLEAA